MNNMMKLIAWVCAASLLCVAASAQDTMLTKDETINYLDRKLREVEGRTVVYSGGSRLRYADVSLKKQGEGLELRYTEYLHHPGGQRESFRRGFRFNPLYLEHFFKPRDATPESAIALMSVRFRSKTVGRLTSGGEWEYPPGMHHVEFFFLAAAPENATRIKKALEHLQMLAKAEDDPFGP